MNTNEQLDNFSTGSMSLTETQLRAARLMAMGQPYKDIARELGVDRTTIYRWRRHPDFSAELAYLTEVAAEESRNRIVRDINEINDIVLSTLIDVAENDTSGSARVSAARVLVDMVERAEERAAGATHDVMRDQSDEIRLILEDLRDSKVESNGVRSA